MALRILLNISLPYMYMHTVKMQHKCNTIHTSWVLEQVAMTRESYIRYDNNNNPLL